MIEVQGVIETYDVKTVHQYNVLACTVGGNLRS